MEDERLTESENEADAVVAGKPEGDVELVGIRRIRGGISSGGARAGATEQPPRHRSRRVQAPVPASTTPPSLSRNGLAAEDSPAVAPGAGDVVGALRESRRALRSAVQDPLDDVRRAAAGVVSVALPDGIKATSAGEKKKKAVNLDPNDPGRVCEVNSRPSNEIARSSHSSDFALHIL